MKNNFEQQCVLRRANKRAYWAAIWLASLACGSAALGQTNNPTAGTPADSRGSTNATKLTDVDVVSRLDVARSAIMPDLGATATTFSADQIQAISQGGNAPFNQVILRAPGVAQDSASSGDLHVRGEHANLQYRINDVLLPEGITGFGLELDPRFVRSMQLITGSLPAQYGFRTAGVVDIQTKSGAFDNGGTAEMYGGSHETLRPSFELGGSEGKVNYFIDGSFDHNSLGIENPTASHDALHDRTDQGKFFSYTSWLLDDTSRLSLMMSGSYSTYQVPNTPGVPAGMSPGPLAVQWVPGTFDSTFLNENQKEQNYFGVLTYQKSVGDLNLQASAFGRYSAVHFTPDPVGDLFFNGVASEVNRMLTGGGVQLDGSYQLAESHTLRVGAMFLAEFARANSQTTAFPVDANGDPTGAPAETIPDANNLHGLFSGVYVQDEWKILPRVTLNFGVRFDDFASSFDNENQLSPRVNLIYQPTDWTTLHAGYSRYFTPPPVENISGATVTKFDNTSNSTGNDVDDPVKAERANYYDIGISQKITKHLQVGVDGYYKTAKDQLDDGLFGQTLILSAFNYDEGRIWGTEFTVNYTQGGFSAYANVAYSVAQGKDWTSAQFLFGPDGPGTDLQYVRTHWISLDHDQRVTGSFGASYSFDETARTGTRLYLDALYGSGLRTDATAGDGSNIPNGGTVPAYYSVNLGAEQTFKINKSQSFKARLDVVNVTDNSYELRDGSGVGVNAAQFGPRIGFFGSISYSF